MLIKYLINGGIVDKFLEAHILQHYLDDHEDFKQLIVILTFDDICFLINVCFVGYLASISVFLIERCFLKFKIYLIEQNFICNETTLNTEFIFTDEVS